MATKKPVSYMKHKWETFWKDLVTTKGRVDKAKLMRELADFSILMEEAASVYGHVTGGRITNVKVMATEVIAAATEVDNEALREILADERLKWEEESPGPGEVCYVVLGGKTAAFAGRHARVTTPEGTFIVAWCSDTDQLFTDEKHPLPHIWRDTAREAIKALLEIVLS
jgi:hypothetical protein